MHTADVQKIIYILNLRNFNVVHQHVELTYRSYVERISEDSTYFTNLMCEIPDHGKI